MPNRSLLNCSFTPLPVTRRLTDAGKRDIREVCIHFVMTGGVSSLMREARRFVQESGLDERLIRSPDESYLLQSLRNANIRNEIVGIFVLEDFSGILYDELRTRQKEDSKCRLVHPLTIFQARKRGCDMRLPFKPHPLRSLTMSAIPGITLSGDLTPDERAELNRQILLMGGAVFQNVSQKRTSIVVGRNVSDARCIMARGMDPVIPIVTPEWIRYCFKETERDHVVCGRKNYQKFLLHPFAGLTLSPAQIDGEQRRKLAIGAETGGYKYQPDLTKGQTTHLICQIAEGAKWSAARSWGVFCVSYQWVTESFANGIALPEKDFLVGPADSDDSFDQFMFEDRFERKSASKGRRTDRESHLDPDIRRVRRSDSPPSTSSLSQDAPGLSVLTQDLRISETNATANRNCGPFVVSEPSLSIKYAHLMDVSREEVCEVFSGIEFGLVSCDADKADFLKKLINNHSGYLNRPAEDMNFIVVGKDELDDEAKDLMEQFKEKDSSAIFVSYKWVIASAEKGSLSDMDGFQFGDSSDDACPVPVAELPSLGFRVTQKNYSQRNRYKELTETSFSASGSVASSELPGDEALLNEYSRRSDSTQSKSPAADLISENGIESRNLSGWRQSDDDHPDAASFPGFDDQLSIVSSEAVSQVKTGNYAMPENIELPQNSQWLRNGNPCKYDRRGDHVLAVNNSENLNLRNHPGALSFRPERPVASDGRHTASNARKYK